VPVYRTIAVFLGSMALCLATFGDLAAAAGSSPAGATPPPPAAQGPPVIYMVSQDRTSQANALSSVIGDVLQSATEVAGRFQMSVVSLSKPYDPTAPQKSCLGPDGQTYAVRPQDLLLAFSVLQASQVSNKFTGADTQDVSISFTRIQCPPTSPQATVESAPSLNGAASPYIGGSTFGNAHNVYWWDPVSGLASVVALLTSPWVNKYRLWLAVPVTVIDSFKNEDKALAGTIYCATANGVLFWLRATQLIQLDRATNSSDLIAYRTDPIHSQKMQVSGVSYCGQQQPVTPSLIGPAPISTWTPQP
jgi:hypothetical protein